MRAQWLVPGVLVRPRFSSRLRAAGAASLLVLGLSHLGRTQQAPAAAPLPPIILEDFEAATLGSRPYLWKEIKANAADATIGAERAELDGNDANKALKIEYTFAGAFDAAHGVDAGPLGQPLPGSLTAIEMMVNGDA